jgi:hypothetical protein
MFFSIDVAKPRTGRIPNLAAVECRALEVDTKRIFASCCTTMYGVTHPYFNRVLMKSRTYFSSEKGDEVIQVGLVSFESLNGGPAALNKGHERR